MAKKKKGIVKPKNEASSKAEEVMKTLLVDEVLPFEGLNIAKKEKHYAHPAVRIENRWMESKFKSQIMKGVIDLIYPNCSLDPKRNRIGIRMIRETEQFDPDYKFETVKTIKTVPRTAEERIEEIEIGKEYFADYILMGAERKTSQVKVVAQRGKDVLITNSEGSLQYCKEHHLFAKELEIKEKEEVVGKIKSEVFRFIGIDFDIADKTSAKIQHLKKGILYVIKGVVKLTKVTNKIVRDKEAEGATCFDVYNTPDPEATFIVPGKLIVKLDKGGIFLYVLLEKTPTKDGIKKSFNLFEMFKVPSKKKEKKEVDLQSKLEAAFGGSDDSDEDSDEDF